MLRRRSHFEKQLADVKFIIGRGPGAAIATELKTTLDLRKHTHRSTKVKIRVTDYPVKVVPVVILWSAAPVVIAVDLIRAS